MLLFLYKNQETLFDSYKNCSYKKNV